jgi:hypothetical protein
VKAPNLSKKKKKSEKWNYVSNAFFFFFFFLRLVTFNERRGVDSCVWWLSWRKHGCMDFVKRNILVIKRREI